MNEELEKKILQHINIYERWGYDFFSKEIILFTAWVMEIDSITYKPKMWFKNISIKSFMEFILKHTDTLKTFTMHNTIFTEKEDIT